MMTSHVPELLRRRVVWPILALLAAGCATTASTPETPPEPAPVAQTQPAPAPEPVTLVEESLGKDSPEVTSFIHTVRWSGETLSLVAQWYTGKHGNWKAVAKANPALNPHRIFKGNEIVIPEKLLETRKPMPKRFVVKATARTKVERKATAPEKKPSEGPALPLFGPKGR